MLSFFLFSNLKEQLLSFESSIIERFGLVLKFLKILVQFSIKIGKLLFMYSYIEEPRIILHAYSERK